MTQPVEDEELRAYREAQIHEYSQFVAKGPIYVGSALAYNEGDPVPASNVKAHRYEEMGLVERVEQPAPQTPDAGSGDATGADAAPQSAPVARTRSTSTTKAGGNS